MFIITWKILQILEILIKTEKFCFLFCFDFVYVFVCLSKIGVRTINATETVAFLDC